MYTPEHSNPEADVANVRVTFLCPAELVAQIDARGDRSEVLRQMLEAYLQMLADARKALQGHFSPAELAVLVEHADAVTLECHQLSLVLRKADQGELASKVLELDKLAYNALRDAILRYKRAVATGMQVDVGGILR